MRQIFFSILAAVCALATPAQAWEAGITGGLCTLTHEDPAAHILVTYDASLPLYSITLTRRSPWPIATTFGIRFDGARPNVITTTRHMVSENGTQVTITDQGFGNVLDGLEFNHTAVAFTGPSAIPIPLNGAARAVSAFRACTRTPSA